MWLALLDGGTPNSEIVTETPLHLNPERETGVRPSLGPGIYTVRVETDFIRRSGSFTLLVNASRIAPTPTPITTTCDREVGVLTETFSVGGYFLDGRFVGDFPSGVIVGNVECIWSEDPKATTGGFGYGIYYAFTVSRTTKITVSISSHLKPARVDLLHGKGRYGDFVEPVYCSPPSMCWDGRYLNLRNGETEGGAILQPGNYTAVVSFASGGQQWPSPTFRVKITPTAP